MGENPFSVATTRLDPPASNPFGQGNPYANAEIEGTSSEVVYRLRARRVSIRPRGGHLRLHRDRLSWGAPPPLPGLVLCGSFLLVGLSRYLTPRPSSVMEVALCDVRSVHRGNAPGTLVLQTADATHQFMSVSNRAFSGLNERLARAMRELDLMVERHPDGTVSADGTLAPRARNARPAPGLAGASVRNPAAYRRQWYRLGVLAAAHLGLIGFTIAQGGTPTTRVPVSATDRSAPAPGPFPAAEATRWIVFGEGR